MGPHLGRYQPVQVEVVGLIHHARAALAQFGVDAVVTEDPADHGIQATSSISTRVAVSGNSTPKADRAGASLVKNSA